MSDLGKKVGYLKGLMEGMDFSGDPSKEKLLNTMADLMSELADRVEAMEELLDDLNDYVESIDDDLAMLDSFVQWLNTLEGFPGITRVEDTLHANLQIHFTDAQGLLDIMGPEFTDLDGAVTYWYDYNAIYDGVICVRTDLHRTLRNSVTLEDDVNGDNPNVRLLDEDERKEMV